MKLKTHKTVSKRIKVSASGKLIKRKAGQGHFNSRESSNVTRAKRSDLAVSKKYVRNIRSLMPHA
jgi:large subunit ribosomal protein L35